MLTTFTKMHGLGNDFMVINNLERKQNLSTDRIRALANRNFGIGFDQLLVVEPASVEGVEFDYRIYNADGGEVEHCGNGARCFAVYVRKNQLTDSRSIRVNTNGGIITLHVKADNQVTVDMGVPTFEPASIPFIASETAMEYSLEVSKETLQIGAIGIGNPHAVLLVDDVDTAPVKKLGALIEKHERFPNRVNVGFVQIIDRSHAKLRVFERGVGETVACGTGACAAMVYGHRKKLLDKSAVLTLSGGDLRVEWNGEHHNVEMTGPCTTVFEGQTEM